MQNFDEGQKAEPAKEAEAPVTSKPAHLGGAHPPAHAAK
jgi:hypothetical protein